MNNNKKKKGFKVYIPLIITVIVVLGGAWYWYNQYSKYIKTDDAHVDTDNISVGAKMMGHIVHLYADEGDPVKQGALLAELDSSELVAQKIRARAMISQADAGVTQANAKYSYEQQAIKVLEVSLKKAQDDLARGKSQFDGGVITQEQFDHLQSAFDATRAQFNAAKTQLEVSRAMITSAHAAVAAAKTQLVVIDTQLANTRLYAPIDGVIAKRWLLPGDITQPGQSVFTITNTHKLWVAVFLEETKIGGVYVGQPTNFTIDAFPGVTFTGKVISIGSNTASQFSLIPANNASGNFTKVTQRIPLKISIGSTTNHGPLSSFNIRAGMSAVVKIIKSRQ